MRRDIAMPHTHSRLRRSLLIAAPLLTGSLLLAHPLPDMSATGLAELPRGIVLYALLAPIADQFLLVHALFPAALALLGLSVISLLAGVPGPAAAVSRAGAVVFGVAYILYETLIGTVTGLLIRGAASLPPEAQAVIGDAIHRNFTDPVFGDLPSVIAVTAWLSWLVAVIAAAVSLRAVGRPRVPCALLGFSAVFVSHASPLGPLGMLLFLLAVIGLERARAPQRAARPAPAAAVRG
jgi:hypothetical protein